MKISKPTLYVIVIGGLLAVAGIIWNIYNYIQENSATSTPEVVSSPVPATKAKASPPAAVATSPSPAPVATSPAAVAKVSPSPVPVAKVKASTSPAPAATSPSKNALAFRDAVNKAIDAAQLTQTAKTKAQWNTVASNWQQAIALMRAVPKANPKYQVAQQKAVEYQSKLNYAKQASQLAK